jgi:hypothetical protein
MANHGSMGAPVLVDLKGETDPLDIANKELKVLLCSCHPRPYPCALGSPFFNRTERCTVCCREARFHSWCAGTCRMAVKKIGTCTN